MIEICSDPSYWTACVEQPLCWRTEYAACLFNCMCSDFLQLMRWKWWQCFLNLQHICVFAAHWSFLSWLSCFHKQWKPKLWLEKKFDQSPSPYECVFVCVYVCVFVYPASFGPKSGSVWMNVYLLVHVTPGRKRSLRKGVNDRRRAL